MTALQTRAQLATPATGRGRQEIEEAFDRARRTQTAMLAEVRRRLAALDSEDRSAEAEILRDEREAARLSAHAAMPENAGVDARVATAQREGLLTEVGVLADGLLVRHEHEQRLCGLAREIEERIQTLDSLTTALSAASGTEDVRVLVDWALAASGGSPAEDDECEADF